MKSRLLTTLLGSALLVGASSVASAQSCSDQIASLQSMMGSTSTSSGATASTGPLDPAVIGDTGGEGTTAATEGAESTADTATSDDSDNTTEELQTGSTAVNNSAAAALQEAIAANSAGNEQACLDAVQRARSEM